MRKTMAKAKNYAALGTFFALFAAGAANAKSLEWQKLELERAIEDKYSRALEGPLKPSEFIVKARVEYSDPGMPNFKDLNKNKFKISDLSFDDSKGDYIAFSKVGLEVPVVGNFREENQQRLKELYRYNESFDLFKNIESVSVDVSVSDRAPEEKFEIAKIVAERVQFAVGEFTPNVRVEKIKLEQAPVAPKKAELEKKKKEEEAKKEKIGLKEILEFIGKFGNAIGLILAVSLLGLLAFKLLKMYMEFMEKLKSMEEPPAAKKDEENDKDKESPFKGPFDSGQEDSGDEDLDPPSFERFQRLLELNSRQAATLVKKWLAEENEENNLALTGAAQQLNHEGMEAIFKSLNINERQRWNSRITGFLGPEELKEANKVISQSVVKELVGGAYIDDNEVVDLILSMDIDSVKDYIERGKHGAALVNLLNPDVVAGILNELGQDQVNKVVLDSLNFNFSQLKENLEDFKADLRSFASSDENPFNSTLMNIVSEVDPDKEGLLYQHLARHAKHSDLIRAAKKSLPSELVFELPAELLKLAMGSYSTNKKVALLASLEDEERTRLMSSFLEPGTNAYEMIKMELEVLQADELRLKRLKNDKDALWKSFLAFIRETIRANEEFAGDIDLLVKQWAKNFASSQEEKTAA